MRGGGQPAPVTARQKLSGHVQVIQSRPVSGGMPQAVSDHDQPKPRAADGRHGLVALAILAMYVVLALGTVSVWEWQHDEGYTMDITVARPGQLRNGGDGVPSMGWPDAPVPVTDLYDYLGGEHVQTFDEVTEGLASKTNLTPPGYFVLLHLWVRLTGLQGLGVHVLGVLIGIASLLAMRRLTAQMLPVPWAPETAMALMAAAPWFLVVEAYLRAYGLALCAMLWTTVAVLSWAQSGCNLSKGERRWPVLFILGSLVGLWSLYHYAFVTAWQGLLLLWLAYRHASAQRGRRLTIVALVGALIVMGTLPLLTMLFGHMAEAGDRTHWADLRRFPPEWPFMLLQLVRRFSLAAARLTALGDGLILGLGLTALVTYPCVVLGLLRHVAGEGRDEAPRRLARAAWWSLPLLPALIVLADILRGTGNVFVTKYVFFLLPVLVLAVTAGIFGPRRVLTRALLGVAWGLLMLIASVAVLVYRNDEPSRLENVAQHLATFDSPQHWVVVSSLSPGFLPQFVMTMREAGVSQVKLTYARDASLEHVIHQARSVHGVTRLTLVNYDLGPAAGELAVKNAWFFRVPQNFKNTVRAAGWKLITVTPGAPTDRSNNTGKPLHLFMRTSADSFHGPQ